jgi:hypothetical protein
VFDSQIVFGSAMTFESGFAMMTLSDFGSKTGFASEIASAFESAKRIGIAKQFG